MIGNYIKAVAAAVSRSTAQLMKTGQTTSYATGDDGDLEAGRNVSFTTLAENNVFGNTNRFTDELGGQTYTNNIAIDWSTYNGSTVLGFRITVGAAVTWSTAISQSLAVSISPFTSGWRLTNIREINNLANYELTQVMNYPPFNIINALWTSNTSKVTTTQAFFLNLNGPIQAVGKTSVANYIPCRTFTVTGTTLS
jgi:hypothetical protein